MIFSSISGAEYSNINPSQVAGGVVSGTESSSSQQPKQSTSGALTLGSGPSYAGGAHFSAGGREGTIAGVFDSNTLASASPITDAGTSLKNGMEDTGTQMKNANAASDLVANGFNFDAMESLLSSGVLNC